MDYYSIVALVTPFRQGEVDVDALESLIKWQLSCKTSGIVLCGSTGEGQLLSIEERQKMIRIAESIIKNKMFLITGCTGTTYEQTKKLVDCSSDIVLVTPPPYLKPSQSGILNYYERLHSETDKRIIIYNNPSRCGVDIDVSTIEALFRLDRIIGIKDSSTDLKRIVSLKHFSNKMLLCGEDFFLPAYLLYGGNGTISVCGNVIPDILVDFMKRPMDRNLAQTILEVVRVLNLESNPVAIKCAMSSLGLCSSEVRYPLMEASGLIKKQIEAFFDGKKSNRTKQTCAL